MVLVVPSEGISRVFSSSAGVDDERGIVWVGTSARVSFVASAASVIEDSAEDIVIGAVVLGTDSAENIVIGTVVLGTDCEISNIDSVEVMLSLSKDSPNSIQEE